MNTFTNKEIINGLSSNICAALSTISLSGILHSNTVYYCFDKNLNIYFASDCTTTHANNIQVNCNVAMCIWTSPESYGKDHVGVQIEGICNELSGFELVKAWGLYIKRFPVFQQKIGNFENLLNKLMNMRLYKIVPKQIQLTNANLYGPQIQYYTFTK